ncbi:SIS domain-containing protein [Bacillus sp. FJAT-47783]|uniref:SIS domain-containing protein n=1 Tax=Bacillus sp. FJAT-47783 TaxID=2922712 RepID=UPI00325FB0FD
MLGEELFYRAGGLVPVNPIFIEDLMLHKGAVRSSQLERTSGIAAHFMKEIDIKRNDVFIIVSTSGRNPVPIEVAQIAKERGAFTIAITSPRYAIHQPSRHPDGLFLYEVVDLVIDNHAPIGDTLLHEEAFSLSFGPSSTAIGSTIINGISAEAINIMIQNGTTPPIFKSGNVDGADEFNKQLIEKYKKRMPYL